MRPLARIPAAAIFLGAALALSAQQPAPPNPALAAIHDDPALPRVLLIGDSISIGYTLDVREILKGTANVHRIPENGGPTINGLEKIGDWLGIGKWDLIHFNWGLHDLKYMDGGKHQVGIEEYEKNLDQLVATMKQSGAKLIWAATTPVPDAKVNPPRKNADVIAYNAAAARVMKKHGVPTDDLYALALPRLAETQRPANVHFTAAGSRVLGEQVAAEILTALREQE
jgi:acyl-CoA thioesterase-1